MKHELALKIARGWVERFAGFCERIEIAGSLRRGKPEVGDIEIVAIPKVTPVTDLFGVALGEISALEDCIQGFRDRYEMVKNGPKYKKLRLLEEGVAIDLFIVTPPAQWGVQFLIRTGPAEFSHWMVTKRMLGGALPNHCYVDKGSVWSGTDGTQIPMAEEHEYFALCGLPWCEPSQRAARWVR